MSKFDEFVESLQKDKKKALVLFAVVIGLFVTIIMGIVFSGGEDETNDKNKQLSGVEVPVDKQAINNGYSYEQSEKTSIWGEVQDTTVTDSNSFDIDAFRKLDSDNKSIYDGYNIPSSKNINGSSPNKSKVSYSAQHSITDASLGTEENKELRRRIPNDDTGNLSYGTSKMYRGVIANGDREVKSGTYVKIRVTEDITIGNLKVKRNSIITGIANYANERMNVDITSIRVGNKTTKVRWHLYDEDGNIGIAVPASILNDIAKDAGSEAGSSVETNAPVVGSVKVNLERKNREVSFIIRDGHRVYIKAK